MTNFCSVTLRPDHFALYSTLPIQVTGVGSGLLRGGSGGSGGGGGGGRGSGGSGEGVHRGVSRREAALSLVRDSETFRSLEGALTARGRHLAGMEEQVGRWGAREGWEGSVLLGCEGWGEGGGLSCVACVCWCWKLLEPLLRFIFFNTLWSTIVGG